MIDSEQIDGSQNLSLDLTMIEEGERDLVNMEDIKKIISRIDQGESFKKTMQLFELNYPSRLNSIVYMNKLHYKFSMTLPYSEQHEL